MNLPTRILQSSLLRSAGIYTLTNIANASIPFILIPILTSHLSPKDYGLISMYTLLIGLTSPFIGLGSQSTLTKRFFSQEKFIFSKYVGNCIILVILTTIVVLLLFLLFNSYLSYYTAITGIWLYTIIAITLSMYLTQILLIILQVQVKPFYYGVIQISQSALNLGLSVWFIVNLKNDWTGRVKGQLWASVFFAILSLVFLKKNKLLQLKFDKTYIKDILRFGTPVIPHIIGGMLLAMTDRIVLANTVGISDTGIYTVAYQIASSLSLLTTSFNNAYAPWLFSKLSQNNYTLKLNIAVFTYRYFLCLLLFGLIIFFATRWCIPFIVGAAFINSANYIGWIIAGFVFNGMYLMVTNYIFYAEKTQYLSYVTLSIMLIHFPLCYFLVKHNGVIGAAQANTISYFIYFVATWLLSIYIYPMPWREAGASFKNVKSKLSKLPNF